MTGAEYSSKLDELDRLLNDPDAPLQPDRVWCLLAEVSRRELAAADRREATGAPRQPDR
nr:peptide chain release factor 1 [uncultured Rhodopila sp.]